MRYRAALRERLSAQGFVTKGMTALCLAARLGTEVKSFIDLGCFAVGIDLNPGKENKYVVVGDFHDLQFADKSVDVVFSNSLDHAFDFTKLIKEIKRVLSPDGFLILELVKGESEGENPGDYEAQSWKTIDDVLKIFTNDGFVVKKRLDFTYPWNGEQVTLGLS